MQQEASRATSSLLNQFWIDLCIFESSPKFLFEYLKQSNDLKVCNIISFIFYQILDTFKIKKLDLCIYFDLTWLSISYFTFAEENLPSLSMQLTKRLARNSLPRSSSMILKLSSSPFVNMILWLTKSTAKVLSNSTKHSWFANIWSWSWICECLILFLYYWSFG